MRRMCSTYICLRATTFAHTPRLHCLNQSPRHPLENLNGFSINLQFRSQLRSCKMGRISQKSVQMHEVENSGFAGTSCTSRRLCSLVVTKMSFMAAEST
jgi:hypothetical protein